MSQINSRIYTINSHIQPLNDISYKYKIDDSQVIPEPEVPNYRDKSCFREDGEPEEQISNFLKDPDGEGRFVVLLENSVNGKIEISCNALEWNKSMSEYTSQKDGNKKYRVFIECVDKDIQRPKDTPFFLNLLFLGCHIWY